MNFTCTTSEHPYFTKGQVYTGIKGSFGWIVKDNNGEKRHIGSVFCYQTSLFLNTYATRFEAVK
jgi:hypothetical protein